LIKVKAFIKFYDYIGQVILLEQIQFNIIDFK